jgi:maltodextrin utilization protein YvdJ
LNLSSFITLGLLGFDLILLMGVVVIVCLLVRLFYRLTFVLLRTHYLHHNRR